MASILLGTIGSVVGGAIGGPAGAIFGKMAGSFFGNQIDQSLFGESGVDLPAPSFDALTAQRYAEGHPIPRVYGRYKLAGQLIWGTDIRTEYREISSRNSGGKGSPSPPPQKEVRRYRYANFAIALCEGEINGIGNMWFNGQLVDQSKLSFRLYHGSLSQPKDASIVAIEGDDIPAFRGVAYMVFDELELTQFETSTLPNIEVEVIRNNGELENNIKAVNIIPGSSEFAYSTTPVTRIVQAGEETSENQHGYEEGTDWQIAMDQLQSSAPNLVNGALIVSWFGDDLRVNHCAIEPKVDAQIKLTRGIEWSVSGLSRSQASQVSYIDGRAAYGGTPSDQSVVEAILDLKSRNIKVCYYPFVMMDIAKDNNLPNPYGGESQPAYPWRGRITCEIAPSINGTSWGSVNAHHEVEQFFGSAQISDFNMSGAYPVYRGDVQDKGYRRFILHNALLAKKAGGVSRFIIGSEMIALTRIMAEEGVFPAAAQFMALADDVRSILGENVEIGYAADWTEYGAYTAQDARRNNDLFFPLDALWSHENIDFIGIDYYPPLSDWRNTQEHLDLSKHKSPYDEAYIQENILGGEAYDFYYSDLEARNAQNRLAISDGSYDEPWVYRAKDISNWWSNLHYPRINGVRLAEPTAFTPQLKPIVLTEFGIPAVNLGANQPNVFPDPKSSESAYPFGSNTQRDDLIQRNAINALLTFWQGEIGANNPISPYTNQPMLNPEDIYIWCFDARPYPYFPNLDDVWGDGANWQTGHWLNGRIGGGDLASIIKMMLEDYGIDEIGSLALYGDVKGYVIDRPMNFRAAIQPLSQAFRFDVQERAGLFIFSHSQNRDIIQISKDHLIDIESEDQESWTSANRREFPHKIYLKTLDYENQYQVVSHVAAMGEGQYLSIAEANLPLVLTNYNARKITENWLSGLWAEKYSIRFSLNHFGVILEVGDLIQLEDDPSKLVYCVQKITFGQYIQIKANSVERKALLETAQIKDKRENANNQIIDLKTIPKPDLTLLELPTLTASQSETGIMSAIFLSPSPAQIPFYQLDAGDNMALISRFYDKAISGQIIKGTNRAVHSRIDYEVKLEVKLRYGQLNSISDLSFLNYGNQGAILHENGFWEIIQFQFAELIGDMHYALSHIIRGTRGTEYLSSYPITSDMRFILLDDRLIDVPLSQEDIYQTLYFGAAADGIWPGDDNFAHSSLNYSGLRGKDWQPVHFNAKIDENDDVIITFQARPALGIENWEIETIANSEGHQVYVIEIYDAAENLLRTLEGQSEIIHYPNEALLADFGTMPSVLNIKSYSKNRVFGEGCKREMLLFVSA